MALRWMEVDSNTRTVFEEHLEAAVQLGGVKQQPPRRAGDTGVQILPSPPRVLRLMMAARRQAEVHAHPAPAAPNTLELCLQLLAVQDLSLVVPLQCWAVASLIWMDEHMELRLRFIQVNCFAKT